MAFYAVAMDRERDCKKRRIYLIVAGKRRRVRLQKGKQERANRQCHNWSCDLNFTLQAKLVHRKANPAIYHQGRFCWIEQTCFTAHAEQISAAFSETRGMGSLTFEVVARDVLKGLIKKDNRKGDLQDHNPLRVTQRGHLEYQLGRETAKQRTKLVKVWPIRLQVTCP